MYETIISNNLSEIIERANITQRYYQNKKSIDRLKNAKNEVIKLESIYSDILLLGEIYKELLTLEQARTQTNGVISTKTTSRELIRNIREDLEKKEQSLISNLDIELHNLPLISDKYYKKLTHQLSTYHDILNVEYKGMIPSYIKDYEKTAMRLVQASSKKIITNKNKHTAAYKVLIGHIEDKDRKQIPQFMYFDNIISATQFIFRREKRKKLIEQIKKINEPIKSLGTSKPNQNIDKQIEELLNYSISKYQHKITDAGIKYPNIGVATLINIKNKIEHNYKKYYSYKKTIEKYDRIIDLLSSDLNNGRKFELIEKMKKEKNLFSKELNDLLNEIKELERKFNDELKRIELKDKELKDKIAKSVERTSKKNGIEELKKLKTKLTSISEPSKKDQKQQYEKYKEYREKLDYILERKNIGTEEQFQREVERELGRFGIGTTYEEIMNNIREIRRQIPSTKIIESIIFEVKNNPEYIDKMDEIDNNGLSNIENRIIGRLETILTNGILTNGKPITDELREEITYYIKRFRKLENEINYTAMNRKFLSTREYNIIIDDNKLRLWYNTELFDESGLMSQVKRKK